MQSISSPLLPAASVSGSLPGATSAPSPSGKAPWPGGGTVESHPGRPHMAGHLNHPPAFSGHSPFGGNVDVDHGAVSQMSRQSFALRRENQELCEQNRDLAQALHGKPDRVDISRQDLGELQDAAKQTHQMEQRAARAQEKAIGLGQTNQRMAQFMEPMTEELKLGAENLRQVKQDNKALKAENTRLNSDLQQVSTELDETQLQLSAKLSEIDTLKSQLERESFDNRALQEQLETVTQEAHTLSEKKHDLEKQLAELGRTKNGQDRHIRYLNQNVKSGQDALKEEQSTRMGLERELHSLKSSESQLKIQLNTTESSLQRSQEQLAESERSLRGTHEELGNTLLEVQNLKRELSQIKGENRENKAFGKEVQAKLREYVQIADSLKADLAKSERSVETLTQKVSEKREEVKALRHALQDSRKNVEVLENTIQQQQSELSGMHRLKAELNTVREDNADLGQRNHALDSKLSQAYEREQGLRDLHHGAISEKRTLEQTLQQKEELITRHESSIQDRESRIDHLRSEVSELKSELATAKSEGNQERLEQLQHDIASKDQQISELLSEKSLLQTRIGVLEDQIERLNVSLTESQQVSRQQKASLERQERLMQDGQVTIQQLRDQVADFGGELASVQEGIQALRSEHTVTRNILDQNLDSLASCQEIARQLDEIVSHPNPEAASLLSKLKQHISGVSAGFTSVAENLQRDSATLDSLQSRTDGLEESVTRKSVSFEDREHVSVRSTTSSMSETKTSGLDHVPHDVLQSSLATDLGMMLDSSNRPIGQGLLRGTDSTVVHLRSRTVEDGSRTDSPRPDHLPYHSSQSQSGALSARHGDGFGSSSEDGVRRHPEHQGFSPASGDRATMDLLAHDFGGDDESHVSFDPASLRGRDTLDIANQPISDDSDSDSDSDG